MVTVSELHDKAVPNSRAGGLWRRLALRILGRAEVGDLTVTFPDGTKYTQAGTEGGPSAALRIRRFAAVRKILLRGDVGLAEAYMDGDWSTPDLGAVLDYGYANEAALSRPMQAWGPLAALLRLRHRLRANTRRGSRRNIAYHYDLGNEFYRLWLDASMTYSSALFERSDMRLEEAQAAKYRQIVATLGIGPEDSVLEIGCGWGGFAEMAARETGCRVLGITLSQEQATFARERIAAAGLSDRVRILVMDYRDVTEQFDKIVSIEMFEAVGEANWPVFFRHLRDCLKPGGQAALQIITVAEDRFEPYRRNIDFIRRYIFPGGLLPTKEAVASGASEAGLGLADARSFGEGYVETLRRWYRRFVEKWPEIAQLGFDERFARMWAFYLCGCEASFKARATDVSQFFLKG